MIAALFVATGGVYFDLPDVDPWDEKRDARRYYALHYSFPVVAHPPCERWGRYWGGGPMLHGTPKQKILGNDGGCFAAALDAVRACGGVLEHPEASHAWGAFRLAKPSKSGGWIKADAHGFTCCVEQGHYGHRARKATWLYAVRADLPELKWGPAPSGPRLDCGFHSKEERQARAHVARRVAATRLTSKENIATPIPFRNVLLSIARSVPQ